MERFAAAAIAAMCLGVLTLAAWLKPASAGHGTHLQLGLPPCNWAMALGRPCPTCGMTTAFARAAHADFAGSFRGQPFGFLLCIMTAAAFWCALHVAVVGSRLTKITETLVSPRCLWTLGALALAAWIYKLLTWT